MPYYFVIVGGNDRPLYELNHPPLPLHGGGGGGGSVARQPPRRVRESEAETAGADGNGVSGGADATALNLPSHSGAAGATEATVAAAGAAADGSSNNAGGAHTLSVFNQQHLNQFVLHAALDVVDEYSWSTRDMYLKNIDRYGDLTVSALLTPDVSLRFMLVHDATDEASKAGKLFLQSVYELYVLRVLCNPFRESGGVVTSRFFHERVQRLAKRHLV